MYAVLGAGVSRRSSRVLECIPCPNESTTPVMGGKPSGALHFCPCATLRSPSSPPAFSHSFASESEEAHKLHRRARHALEPLEVHPQDAEVCRPALLQAVELIVPVVRAGEEAMHHADDTDASPARFDAPFVRDVDSQKKFQRCPVSPTLFRNEPSSGTSKGFLLEIPGIFLSSSRVQFAH